MLDLYKLEELETKLAADFSENLLTYLCKLNQTGNLEEWLSLIGLSSLVEREETFKFYKTGKVVVIGESKVSRNDLELTAKKIGFDKSRFEFYLDYEAIKKETFVYLQYSFDYGLILVGPMPHKGKGIQDNTSSIITTFETVEGFPPVKRLGDNTLKITKSNFKEALLQAVDENLLKPDFEVLK